MRIRVAGLAGLLCCLSLICGTACGGGKTDPPPTSAPAPVIAAFSASLTSISSGQSSTLSWSVTGATQLSINQGIGDVTGTSSRVVSPTATTTYTLSATNAGGTASATATVNVANSVPPPTITSFTANPTSISSGQTSTLSWSVTGATQLTINQSIGVVTGTNSRAVSPTSTTTYTLSATNAGGTVTESTTVSVVASGSVRIAFLHHSTGGNIWNGGVLPWMQNYNAAHSTDYQISEHPYPDSPYPWANYPYDYWNLWVNPSGPSNSTQPGVYNLETLTANYEVIVFKHCFPVGEIVADTGNPSVSSSSKRVENYKLQYDALKQRLHQFPNRKFILWTGAALRESATNATQAQRARDFFTWVKTQWDEKDDNIFIWDFYELETEGGLYLKPEYATGDSHPNVTFSQTVAPYFAQRVVNVIEGRGDTTRLDGKD